MLVWLALLSLAMAAAILLIPDYAPVNLLLVPLVVSSLTLGPRDLPWFVVYVLILVAAVVMEESEIDTRLATSIGAIFLVGLIVLLYGFRRARLGVTGMAGDSMFVDLRDRILRQGTIPRLPQGWLVESELRSAGGTPFAGDFVVASSPDDGSRFDMALVDVSGKGAGAGTRALLLSGAFGALLAAVEPCDFLGAANDYLLRQDWDEGFATAVHFSLDLATGEFALRTAGHPPAARLAAGTGRWSVEASEGPALGLIPDADFVACEGILRPGDAMMLYTDGLVELPNRDIGLGIDRLLGQAERVLRGDFQSGARRLIDSLGAPHDDRALVLIHRR